MEIPAMNGVHWTDYEKDVLAQRYAERVTPDLIAKEMSRTKNSVRTRASLLGITSLLRAYRTTALPKGELRLPKIIEIIERYFGMPHSAMMGNNRARRIARPRQIAMTMGVEFTNLSWPHMARYFGRDHTTLLYAARNIQERCRTDARLAAQVSTIRKIISDACCSRVAERMCERAWDELESHSAGV